MAAGSNGIRAGRAYVELGANDQLTAALARAQKQLREFGSAIESTGAGIAAAGTAMAAFGGAIVAAGAASVVAFTSIYGRFSDLAAQTGLSVEAMSELETAIKDVGATVEDFAKSALKLQRNLAEAANGSTSLQEGFAALGLDVEKLLALSADEQMVAFAEALSRVENPSQRVALAMQLLGKGAAPLLPLLSQGAAGMARFRAEARALGLSISGDTANAADALGTQMEILKDQIGRVASAFGEILAPAAGEIVAIMQGAVGGIIDWIRSSREAVQSVALVGAGMLVAGGAVAAFGGALVVTVGGLSAAASAVTVFGTILPLVSAGWGLVATSATAAWAAMTGPVGIAVAALVGVGATVFWLAGGFGAIAAHASAAFGRISTSASAVASDIVAAFGGVSDALAAGDLGLAGEIAIEGLRLAFFDGLRAIKVEMLEFLADMGAKIVGWALTLAAPIGAIFASSAEDLVREFAETRLEALRLSEGTDNAAERKELDSLIERAKELRAARDAMRNAPLNAPAIEEPAIPELVAPAIERAIEAVVEAAPAVAAVSPRRAVGTFSAAAAQGLFGGTDPLQQRIAQASAATAENTKRLLEEFKARDIVWS